MTYEAPKVIAHNTHERSTLQPAHCVLPRLPMRSIALGKAVDFTATLPEPIRADPILGVILPELTLK